MITVIRTATAFPGMTGEAVSWAREIAAAVKRVTGKEQIVATSFAGMLADIAWIGHYDSVGPIRRVSHKSHSRPSIRRIAQKGSKPVCSWQRSRSDLETRISGTGLGCAARALKRHPSSNSRKPIRNTWTLGLLLSLRRFDRNWPKAMRTRVRGPVQKDASGISSQHSFCWNPKDF